MKTKLLLASSLALLVPLLTPACSDRVAAAPHDPAAKVGKEVSLAPFQTELLHLAFRAASAFPLDPHRKNRSRAQEVVVAACFALDQPQLALAFAHDVADWRRGCAYADYAWHCARRGELAQARTWIERTEAFTKELQDDPTAQEWRRDLIAMKTARALAALGDVDGAGKIAATIDAASSHAVDADWAQTAAERARLVPADKVGEELAAMHAAFPGLSLGQQHTEFATLVRLHERFFAVAEARTTIEDRLVNVYTKVPPAIRLEALGELATTCLAHDDQASALRLLAVAREITATRTWRPDDQVPQLAHLAGLRGRAGEMDQARLDAEAALAIYHRDRDKIVDVYRAETVRPLALAWHTLGEAVIADDLFALALEEGMVNPNSRPRTDDLVDTCVAMATHRIAPSARLLARMQEVVAGLGNPW